MEIFYGKKKKEQSKPNRNDFASYFGPAQRKFVQECKEIVSHYAVERDPESEISGRLLTYPGVLIMECRPVNRAYFVESDMLFLDIRKLRAGLKEGNCPNQKIAEDLQKYGFEKFFFNIVDVGPQYENPEKRKLLLDSAKESWKVKGELY